MKFNIPFIVCLLMSPADYQNICLGLPYSLSYNMDGMLNFGRFSQMLYRLCLILPDMKTALSLSFSELSYILLCSKAPYVLAFYHDTTRNV